MSPADRFAELAGDGERFFASPGLRWRSVDGQWVVYSDDPPSVSEIGALPAAVLFLLEPAPLSVSGVQLGLAELRRDEDSSSSDDSFLEVIQQLLKAGLIDVVPS